MVNKMKMKLLILAMGMCFMFVTPANAGVEVFLAVVNSNGGCVGSAELQQTGTSDFRDAVSRLTEQARLLNENPEIAFKCAEAKFNQPDHYHLEIFPFPIAQ